MASSTEVSPPSNPPAYAFVTLLTTDSYLAGALTCVNSLLDVEGTAPVRKIPFDTICLVTPSTVSQATLKALEKTFDKVVGVEPITTNSWAELDLLGRKDLSAALTKLHVFRLLEYKKIIFLDADTLILRPLSQLFQELDSKKFSAAPDSGWPDAFNSGFMVIEPSMATFEDLVTMMHERGSWDGGDQGLLNDFFSDWNRLSFTYNVTPSAYYTYAPAYRRHGSDVNVLHFIGSQKPWSLGTRASYIPTSAQSDYHGLIAKWFDVYERHFGLSSTWDVDKKVVNPPMTFKSSYVDLEPHRRSSPDGTTPIPISANRETQAPTWDPARSSPPRDSNHHQMREAITAHYSNMWDDPSKRKQMAKFEPPSTYAPVPHETRDWYKDVINQKRDPSAVKAVFPWEEEASATGATKGRTFPNESEDERERKTGLRGGSTSLTGSGSSRGPPPPGNGADSNRKEPPTGGAGSGVALSSGTAQQAGSTNSKFTNAWDSVPGIGRYVKSLAKSTAPKKQSEEMKLSGNPGSASSSVMDPTGTASVDDGMGGRKSSLKEPRVYERRSDASSRDGDDEDDDENETTSSDEDKRHRPGEFVKSFKHGEEGEEHEADGEERDRIKINFKKKGTSSDGNLSPNSARGRVQHQVEGSSGSSPSPPAGSGHAAGNGLVLGAGLGFIPPPLSPTKSRHQLKSPPRSAAGNMNATAGIVEGRTKPSMRVHSFQSIAPGDRHAIISAPSGLASPSASPRLAAQAIRNSAAARMSASGTGTGDGPPLVRATRVFSPDTDTGVVKKQGLAALQRFVQDMETQAAIGGQQTQPPHQQHPHTGGRGTAGALLY